MPIILMTLALALSLIAFQAHRLQLTELAAMASRAIARGETEPQVRGMLLVENSPVVMQVEQLDQLICVNLKIEKHILWLGKVDILERHCARNQGL